MFILDIIGYIIEQGVFHLLAAGLGIYTIAQVFLNQNVTYIVAYDPISATFKTQTIDPNLIILSLLIVTIASLLFIYVERYA